MNIFAEILGVIGSICIVYSYFAIEKGWMNRDDLRYYVINLAGAILLTISLIFNFNLGSFMIEMFWIWISVAGLIRLQREKKSRL